MTTRTRRKCRHCGQLFRPDPRNLRHQRYCSAKECCRASKAASQRRWLAKAENRDYFRGPEQMARVTSAVLDRLLHHAETVTVEGNSFRMKDVIDK